MKKIDILQAPYVKEMIETTSNLYRLGWDERNGGNISYLLKEEENSKVFGRFARYIFKISS